MLHFAEYESPIGRLLLCSDGKALTCLRFGGEGAYICEDEVLTRVKRWLDAYFCGNSRPVDCPLAPERTAFQKLVWDLLREVPYGRTCTYGGLAKEAARRLGKERMSAQAVGQAVGRLHLPAICWQLQAWISYGKKAGALGSICL